VASGSTTQAFAREIVVNDHLTVITSTFSVASTLAGKSNVDVIQLGGMVRDSSMAVIGPFAEQMLAGLSCSKLFIGVDGVDLEYGLTTTNHMEANLHRQMVSATQKVIVLVDSSKFGRRGFSKICDLDMVDQIITDASTPLNVVEKLQDSGIEVTVVNADGVPI
ncbi:MAG: DeoR/GlpR family DNA-binding transcription regulator, partial [Alistipes sp.]